ncbi:hypothetical protein DVH24_001138 [Malus domestica]|uniref:Uncharacterized protein n=1 Tax=Malus domestica TaxID=3750 RepID=A0A498K3L6_MALDO|nr:hypothetical protein DVH24_001138 [Malus domestica]
MLTWLNCDHTNRMAQGGHRNGRADNPSPKTNKIASLSSSLGWRKEKKRKEKKRKENGILIRAVPSLLRSTGSAALSHLSSGGRASDPDNINSRSVQKFIAKAVWGVAAAVAEEGLGCGGEVEAYWLRSHCLRALGLATRARPLTRACLGSLASTHWACLLELSATIREPVPRAPAHAGAALRASLLDSLVDWEPKQPNCCHPNLLQPMRAIGLRGNS